MDKKTRTGNFPVRVSSFFTETQQIVGADAVILAECDQMVDGQFVGPALIPGIHGLGSPQDLCDLRLGFVGIFPQVPQNADIVHLIHVGHLRSGKSLYILNLI